MKSRFVLFSALICGSICSARAVTLAQCKSALNDIAQVRTEKDFKMMVSAMTSGDEMQLSTSLASCMEHHSEELPAPGGALLNAFIYKLDADVIARMWDFIEKRGLADAYNDEQEAKRVKH